MALHFDGSSYIKFPSIRHSSSIETFATIAVFRPDGTGNRNQYLLGQYRAADAGLGGNSIYFPNGSGGGEIDVYVGRDTLKHNVSTDDPLLFDRWNVVIIRGWGDLTDLNNPIIQHAELYYPSTLAQSSDTNTAGSGSYLGSEGSWVIGSTAAGSLFFLGDIAYIAHYINVNLETSQIISLISGINPLTVETNHLVFFANLHDPNNVIDIISGRKAGIIGTLTPVSDPPRLNF